MFMSGMGLNSQAQCVHPLTFGSGEAGNNSFLDFVGILGERLLVTQPAAVAGFKNFTTPNNGSGASGSWGGYPSTPGLVNDTVMNYPADSILSAVVPASAYYLFAGKVALIYRGGTQFGTKAARAQAAGAIACVIVNNVDGGPVGMAAGTDGSSVTIPVFMISKSDGDAINAQLHMGQVVLLDALLWSAGNANDLGLVDNGIATWHNGAIPSYELGASSNPMPYNGFDGAFVANFGTADASNVTLTATTQFTPMGGSATQINYDSVVLPTFTAADSVWAMYCNSYNLSQYVTGPGTVNVTYNVYEPGVIDQFPADNTVSYSVNVTDNVYCKGRWDAANNRPYCTIYTGPAANASGTDDDYLWGPAYYINNGRYASQIQFSLVTSNSTGLVWDIPTGSTAVAYLFNWVDGSGATLADGIMTADELWITGIGEKTFAAGDSSFKYYTMNVTDSTGAVDSIGHMKLNSNSWYWLAVDMPQGGLTTSWGIGCDGLSNGFPRLYGRDTFPDSSAFYPVTTSGPLYVEYYEGLWAGGNRGDAIAGSEGTYTMLANPSSYPYPVPFAGLGYHPFFFDSTVFANTKGLVPNVSLSTTMWPTKTATTQAELLSLDVYPIPANNNINVSLKLGSTAKQVTYRIITTTGRGVSTETRCNVKDDVYTFNTDKLAAGVYYMIVLADDRPMYRRFTVVH